MYNNGAHITHSYTSYSNTITFLPFVQIIHDINIIVNVHMPRFA